MNCANGLSETATFRGSCNFASTICIIQKNNTTSKTQNFEFIEKCRPYRILASDFSNQKAHTKCDTFANFDSLALLWYGFYRVFDGFPSNLSLHFRSLWIVRMALAKLLRFAEIAISPRQFAQNKKKTQNQQHSILNSLKSDDPIAFWLRSAHQVCYVTQIPDWVKPKCERMR